MVSDRRKQHLQMFGDAGVRIAQAHRRNEDIIAGHADSLVEGIRVQSEINLCAAFSAARLMPGSWSHQGGHGDYTPYRERGSHIEKPTVRQLWDCVKGSLKPGDTLTIITKAGSVEFGTEESFQLEL